MKCNKKSKSGEEERFKSLSSSSLGLARYIARLAGGLSGAALPRTTYSMRWLRQLPPVWYDRLKTPDCPPKDCKGRPMEMVYYKPQGCPTLQ